VKAGQSLARHLALCVHVRVHPKAQLLGARCTWERSHQAREQLLVHRPGASDTGKTASVTGSTIMNESSCESEVDGAIIGATDTSNVFMTSAGNLFCT
jgi:hypothetical protein